MKHLSRTGCKSASIARCGLVCLPSELMRREDKFVAAYGNGRDVCTRCLEYAYSKRSDTNVECSHRRETNRLWFAIGCLIGLELD